jgi:hypothetical protein
MLLWEVWHPEHERVQVEAEDRLHAVVEAAHAWGVTMWTDVARECSTSILGEAPKKPTPRPAKKAPAGGKGKAQ